MKTSIRALLAACGAAVALTAITAAPAQADTGRVHCPSKVLEGRIPDTIDLVLIDSGMKPLCFSGQSRRAMKVDIYDIQQIYKHDDVRSITLMVEVKKGDPRSKWDRIHLNADKPGHWYLGRTGAYRIDSIHIKK